MKENEAIPLIGLFNDCFPPIIDGVSMTVQNYARWLYRKMGNVCVVAPQCPDCQETEPYPVYRYRSYPLPFRKPYRWGLPQVDRTFRQTMDRLPLALVHAHCPFTSGLLALKLAHSNHLPLVATFHSKYRMDFERMLPNRWMVDRMVRRMVQFYESADEVWIPQAKVEETLRKYGYKGKVEVVENGNDLVVDDYEDLRRRSRQNLGLFATEPVFLFVGQHIWEKNINFLLQALTHLQEMPYKMFFVGTGYDERAILNKATRLALLPKVKFVGPVHDRELLKQYYAAADLFLFPSMYDNAPLVVREAAVAHTPAVLLRNSTCAEVVENDWNGFLSPSTPEEYAELIQSKVLHPVRMRQAGLHAAQTIAHPWSEVVDEALDRYIHLMKRV